MTYVPGNTWGGGGEYKQRALVHSNLNYTTTFIDIQLCTKAYNSLLYPVHLNQLVPTNQSDWRKALTELLEISTTSQLFIDTNEMHHIPIMESSTVLVKIALSVKLTLGVRLRHYCDLWD